MDQLKNFTNSFTGGNNQQQGQNTEGQQQQAQQSSSGGGGFLGGFGDKLNSAAGGGRESEKNEDMLDKGWGTHRDARKNIYLYELTQALITSRRILWAKELRITRVLLNRLKMNKSLTIVSLDQAFLVR